MKVRVKDVRKIVREEFMRGVPEFVFREAVDKFVEEIRQQLKKHILVVKKDPTDQREAIRIANETLKELEQEAYELLENKLWQYAQRT